jgi:hypothetical protein
MGRDRILIDWQDVNAEDGSRWTWTLALYAIVHPNEGEILYLGKADGTSVGSRWAAADKHDRVWRRIEKELGIFEHSFLVGEFYLASGVRLSGQLVADVESLLIYRLKPRANTQCIDTRNFSRPGLLVDCEGEWPLSQRMFRDE